MMRECVSACRCRPYYHSNTTRKYTHHSLFAGTMRTRVCHHRHSRRRRCTAHNTFLTLATRNTSHSSCTHERIRIIMISI